MPLETEEPLHSQRANVGRRIRGKGLEHAGASDPYGRPCGIHSHKRIVVLDQPIQHRRRDVGRHRGQRDECVGTAVPIVRAGSHQAGHEAGEDFFLPPPLLTRLLEKIDGCECDV